jgi:hypothetical protein
VVANKLLKLGKQKLVKGRVRVISISDSEYARISKNQRQFLKKIDFKSATNYKYESNTKALKQDPKILEVINKVSIARLEKDISHLLSYKYRGMGQPGNIESTEWLVERFKTYGLSVSKQCFRDNVCNVVAKRKGTNPLAKEILVGAHFDTVGRAFAGADDNTSGTVGLLEIADILKGKAR